MLKIYFKGWIHFYTYGIFKILTLGYVENWITLPSIPNLPSNIGVEIYGQNTESSLNRPSSMERVDGPAI